MSWKLRDSWHNYTNNHFARVETQRQTVLPSSSSCRWRKFSPIIATRALSEVGSFAIRLGYSIFNTTVAPRKRFAPTKIIELANQNLSQIDSGETFPTKNMLIDTENRVQIRMCRHVHELVPLSSGQFQYIDDRTCWNHPTIYIVLSLVLLSYI